MTAADRSLPDGTRHSHPFSRRRLLALSSVALAGVAGCTDDGGAEDDRACATDGRGCDAETAAATLDALVEDGTDLRIEVAVDGTLLTADELGATHTTTAPNVREDPGGGEIMEELLEVADRYRRVVDEGFEVGDLSAQVIDSFSSPEEFASYRVEHEWAERRAEGEWDDQEFDTAVLETVDFSW
ncbi:hypothetical protein [Halalkalicoccus tibetensis]|uniref:DUF8159 domain-containing protein n=1 Tax=Halalkalicoccus tibetensis TaxID=175632 RepID=A0ABD5V666_9EURY